MCGAQSSPGTLALLTLQQIYLEEVKTELRKDEKETYGLHHLKLVSERSLFNLQHETAYNSNHKKLITLSYVSIKAIHIIYIVITAITIIYSVITVKTSLTSDSKMEMLLQSFSVWENNGLIKLNTLKPTSVCLCG